MDDFTDSDFVADDFGEGGHHVLDAAICRMFPVVNSENAPAVLIMIVKQLGSRPLAKYGHINECEALLNNHPRILDLIVNESKNGYKSLRLLKLLREEPVDPQTTYEAVAVERGWRDDYIGNAPIALWDHIRRSCDLSPESNEQLYAKYCSIVQSSGTGKSRTVDEMSKFHFTIPMVLRNPDSTGYPPSDQAAYIFLSGGQTQSHSFLRSCAFLHALFLETACLVKGFRGSAAQEFRNYMIQGMQHGGHGKSRTKFYNNVVTKAKGIYSTYSAYFDGKNEGFPPSEIIEEAGLPPSDSAEDTKLRQDGFPLRTAFHELCEALSDQPVDNKKPSKRRKLDQSSNVPSVILAFDEIHTLAAQSGSYHWSHFSELRRAIRGLKTEPLFTIFLSTSGTLFSVTPTPKEDISARMNRSGDVILPFCDLGFDQQAIFVDFAKTVRLSKMASEEQLISFGRPLWYKYFQSPEKDDVIEFAAFKLLGGIGYTGQPLTPEQELACLAHRIPIEFLSAHYVSQISSAEKGQVHSHMRIILKIYNSLDSIVTTSPSEPTLSEAAYFIMNRFKGFSAPRALKKILDGFAVNKGELGELIVALLFIVARDKAVGPPYSHGPPLSGHRWCSVTELMASLFISPSSKSASGDHINVMASHGWHFTPGCVKPLQSTLAEKFKESKVYFTHFIKVHQHAITGVEYLMRLMARGAAILCGNGQAGTDGIIPFLLEGDEIRQDNVGVIMFQVKNNADFTHQPKANTIRQMDPHHSRITTNIPIIRLLFAVASGTPALKLVSHESSDVTGPGSYSAYDFWIAGLSPDLLAPVANDADAWNDALHASHRWQHVYTTAPLVAKTLRMSTNPGVAKEDAFWKMWTTVPK